MAYSARDRTDHEDIQHVHNEEDVPNSAKTEPTQEALINILSAVAVVLAALALVLGLGFEWEILGIILAIGAAVLGGVLIAMALGDARAGAAAPIAATVVAVVSTLVVGLAMSLNEPTESDPYDEIAEGDELEGTALDPDTAGRSELLDGDANLGDADDEAELQTDVDLDVEPTGRPDVIVVD